MLGVCLQGSAHVPSNSPHGLCGRKATHAPSIAFRHLPKEFEGNTEIENEGPAELKKSCMKGEAAVQGSSNVPNNSPYGLCGRKATPDLNEGPSERPGAV